MEITSHSKSHAGGVGETDTPGIVLLFETAVFFAATKPNPSGGRQKMTATRREQDEWEGGENGVSDRLAALVDVSQRTASTHRPLGALTSLKHKRKSLQNLAGARPRLFLTLLPPSSLCTRSNEAPFDLFIILL